MVFERRSRISGCVCAVALLVCELICHPFVELGIADDWSYIRTVQLLATTGHIVYNGWATAMLGWQLYLAAGLVRIFGFSFTCVRISTLLVALVTAFLMQRTLVRAGVSEGNAVIGTLAIVLSPIYMMLSVTFMTDIGGLFAIVLCLYGCLRAVQATTPEAAAGWICFAALTNGICGSSRQIAWLGVLVMVPCTLWLLRDRRVVLRIGGMGMLVGWGIVAFCMHWFPQQPYSLQEHLLVKVAGLHQAAYMVRELLRAMLEIPFLILAITVAFLPELRRSSKGAGILMACFGVGYTLVALHMARSHGATAMLEPFLRDWLGQQGFYQYAVRSDDGPVVLGTAIRAVLTATAMVGLLGIASFLRRSPKLPLPKEEPAHAVEASRPSWKQLGVILLPFAAAYFGLLIPRSKAWVLDRYMLDLAFVAALCLARAYQEFVRPTLPAVSIILVGLIGLYSIGCTHDMFAYYRARLELARELEFAGIPDHAIDGGFEFDYGVELEHAGHINDERITNPPDGYVPIDQSRDLTCEPRSLPGTKGTLTPEEQFTLALKQQTDPHLPHYTPLYGIAYNPGDCRGAAPFPPVSYFRWLGFHKTNLYSVKYGPR